MPKKSFWDTVIEDMKAAKVPMPGKISRVRTVLRFLRALVEFPCFFCVFLFRVNHLLWQYHLPWKFFNILRWYWFRNDISCRANIGAGLHIVHGFDIVIPSGAVIGRNCTILNGVTIGSKKPGEGLVPVIGDYVYIGTGAKLIGAITIGNSAVIGALTLCNKSVPDGSTVVGVPMRILDRMPS